MSEHCCAVPDHAPSGGYRKVLIIALVINAIMFFAEVVSSYYSNSVSLLADSIDFFGDAANYAISLFVLNLSLQVRAKASLLKAASMGIFGIGVIGSIIYQVIAKDMPHAETMGIVGVAALFANVFVATILFRYREGDSNMRSVWLCTRNDAIGNILVVIAAAAVSVTGTMWPDLIVGLIMGVLGISAAIRIYKHARQELKTADA